MVRSRGWLRGGGLGSGVDFVCEDVFAEGEADGVVEAREQLGQRLVVAANQHGEAVIAICGGGDAANRFEDAEGNLAVVDEPS